MATFDIIESVSNGYAATWRERQWLARLALVPVAVKIFSLEVLVLLGFERNFLAQAIVLLPAFFLEGWLLVRFARLVGLGERWPDHQDAPGFRPDPRPVLAGILVYVLIQFGLRGLVAAALPGLPAQVGATPGAPPDMMAFAAAMGILLGAFWAFRYLWLYIPAGMGIPIRDFLAGVRGFSVSFSMIGAWIACFAPFMLAFGVVAGLFFSPQGGEAPSAAADFLVTAAQAVVDTIILLVSTAAMTYGIGQMLTSSKP